MSLASVRQFFAENAPDIEIIVTRESSATVALAAQAHGVRPEQIAKTISVRGAGGLVVIVVMAGTARLDNRKFRQCFGLKPRMLDAQEVERLTGHPVGGVCPFGLPAGIEVYLDVSLQRYDEVVPAAGATNAAVKISPGRMAFLLGASWIDVGQTLPD